MTKPQPSTAKSSSEMWTVKQVLEWTTGYFGKQGFESPRLEAELLLAHVRKCQRIELYTHHGEILSDDHRANMRELVRRRAKHEPVAYLTGKKEFFSLDFEVSKDVLIPRPETELLVEETLTAISEKKQPLILELGTGSGCIACSLAVKRADASITAVDLSPAALDIARQNAKKHAVQNRIRFLEGNLFEPVERNERFDVILSNPPYVCDHELAELDADVRDHEPKLALLAGKDGLDVIRRIIAKTGEYLTDHGVLLLEFDPAQSEAIRKMCLEHNRFSNCRIIKDLARRDRVAVIQK